MDKLVTVIIPVYNGECYLAEAIESVLTQNYTPIELIAVDDGSTDNTKEIIQSYREVNYVYQSNRGVSAARNVALSAARGALVAFLDADDVWMPGKLELQAGFLNQHPEIEYTLTGVEYILQPGMQPPVWFRDSHLKHGKASYYLSSLVARKTLFERIGRFDERLRTAEDTNWFGRAIQAGASVKMFPGIFLIKRIHSANLTANTSEIQVNVLRSARSWIKNKGETV
ncbi:MAG: glycosyltransferase family 2 protein [Anaerolineales bacterium]|nr:glycosyltransferase family 2 protein [Anaerolineales bacterium]